MSDVPLLKKNEELKRDLLKWLPILNEYYTANNNLVGHGRKDLKKSKKLADIYDKKIKAVDDFLKKYSVYSYHKEQLQPYLVGRIESYDDVVGAIKKFREYLFKVPVCHVYEHVGHKNYCFECIRKKFVEVFEK